MTVQGLFFMIRGLILWGENFEGNPFELYTTRSKNSGYFEEMAIM